MIILRDIENVFTIFSVYLWYKIAFKMHWSSDIRKLTPKKRMHKIPYSCNQAWTSAPKIRNKVKVSLLPYLFHIVPEVIAIAISQGKLKRQILERKKETFFIFRWKDSMYENL